MSASHTIGQFILQIRRLERQPRSFGNAGELTPSEIHVIDAIGSDEGCLMSDLAARLGVTKGAATQLVARLEQRGLIARGPHPTDARAVIVSLTALGQEAFYLHAEMHQQFYNQLRAQFSETEIAAFEQCLETLCRMLKH
ncbi:MarR family transcriptional regulator [Paenibacillus sp. 481]|nr:MarR family transcriptional regulator [Paenibacillus sp. 481]UHA75765.1 MarR family transcriptional regulator [Paenibacillus sp. 481]